MKIYRCDICRSDSAINIKVFVPQSSHNGDMFRSCREENIEGNWYFGVDICRDCEQKLNDYFKRESHFGLSKATI